ncbi:MAG: NADP-dependent oxidoreductase [Verrucomicrobiota bacterium]
MRAIYLERKAGPESLTLGDIPKPSPKEGEVLVKVYATSVMPTEFNWYPTFHTAAGEPRPFPIVLSHELCGKVEAVGANVNRLNIGDVVYGMNDWFTNGAQADYCVAPASALARSPKSLEHTRSAVVPISALTAWQGLFDRAGLQGSQRILIHGGSGAVGTFAVQLARWRGAHVIATTSGGSLDFVRSLGANEVIDYQTTRFEDEVYDLDVVFDSVGSDTLSRSWDLLRAGGKLVTIVSQLGEHVEKRARDAFMLVQANGSQLARISELIDGGVLRVYSEGVFPLDRARDAYERARRGRMRGKIALSVVG